MRRVFISYSYHDQKYAEELREALAKLEIGGGLDPIKSQGIVLQSIREGLDAADVVVVLLSQQALDSVGVNFELGAAQALGKKIVPIELADINLDRLDFIEWDPDFLDARKLSPSEMARQIEELVTES